MIVDYYRPETMEEALKLLAQDEPRTLPMGGGTILNAPSEEAYAVVDLQNLGLDRISVKGSNLNVGAMATLQVLLDTKDLLPALTKAIQHEATYNLRQVGTVAGTLVSADGRSPFSCVMLALDAQLTLQPDDETVGYGEILPVRKEKLAGRIITQITIQPQIELAYEYSARSPADLMVVGAAAARWKSGRTRVVLGGYGSAPLMVVEGKDENDILPAVENAYSEAGDEWASAEYRKDAAVTLARRCLEQLV